MNELITLIVGIIITKIHISVGEVKLILCGNNGNSVFLVVAWDRYLGTGVCDVFAHSGSE